MQRSRGKLRVRTVGLVHHLLTHRQGSFSEHRPTDSSSLPTADCGLPGGVCTAGVVVPLFSCVLPLLAAVASAYHHCSSEHPARPVSDFLSCLSPLPLVSLPPVRILPSFILPVSVPPSLNPDCNTLNTTLLRLCQHRYCTLALPLAIPSQLTLRLFSSP